MCHYCTPDKLSAEDGSFITIFKCISIYYLVRDRNTYENIDTLFLGLHTMISCLPLTARTARKISRPGNGKSKKCFKHITQMPILF